MMLRATSRMARSTRISQPVRCASTWGWESLVGPTMPKEVVEDCRALDSSLTTRNQLAGSLPKTVEAIDWEHWGKTIQAPGVVDTIKKEYEALQFTNHTISSAGEVLDHNAAIVNNAKKRLALYDHEIAAASVKIAEYKKAKVDSDTWQLKDWYNFMPGVEQQFRDEAMRDEWAQDARQEALENLDLKEIIADIKNGKTPNMPTPFLKTVGDLDVEEEAALKESGDWSIARLNKSKEERDAIQEKVRSLIA